MPIAMHMRRDKPTIPASDKAGSGHSVVHSINTYLRTVGTGLGGMDGSNATLAGGLLYHRLHATRCGAES